MLTDEMVPAEGARYAASVVLFPGLWSGRDACRNFATYLAHRGWECRLLDLRGAGSFSSRTTALTRYLAALPGQVVLIGHDAGGLVAARAAHVSSGTTVAVVILAPLVPGGEAVRALTLDPWTLFRIVFRRPVPPPASDAAELAWGDLPPSVRADVRRRLGPEEGAPLRDLLRGRVVLGRVPVPTLVVAGERDRLLAPEDAARLADRLGGEARTLEGAGHWLLAGPSWQRAVALVHRWLVQRLGEPLLERYAEAMAERDADE